MYYQVLPRRMMPHLYIPGGKGRGMMIPVKQQPPADMSLKRFCVEMDVGWAYVHDLFFGNNEDRLAPKYAIRSTKRIQDIETILSRIFIPSEKDDSCLQGVDVEFVPLLWYKDNKNRNVTILSSLWFNKQSGVAKIVMAPLGQEGVVFVDLAYTVTKHGLKLTVMVEREVNKHQAMKDINNNFLKTSVLDDLMMVNDDLEEMNNGSSSSETFAAPSQVLADMEKRDDDNTQIITRHLENLSTCPEDGADVQRFPSQINCQNSVPILNGSGGGGDGEVQTGGTPVESHTESLEGIQIMIRQVLRDQQQIRDDYEREAAELKQRLQVLLRDADQLRLQQQAVLDTIATDEQGPDILEGTHGQAEPSASEGRVDLIPAYSLPIQDTNDHNYKELQMLEFENHLQLRARETGLQEAMPQMPVKLGKQIEIDNPPEEMDPAVWKGRPPSPTELKNPWVTTLKHYVKAGSTFDMHLGHCLICKKTIKLLLHGTRCQEDGCTFCLLIAGDLARHIVRCARGTKCLLPLCASGVPLRLSEGGSTNESPMFVGLVRLHLRRMFSCG